MNSSARQSWNINAGVLLRDLVSLLGLICVAGMPSNLGAQTGGGFKPPQEIDGSRTDPNAPPNASTQIGQGPSGDANISSRQAFNQLVKELDNLGSGCTG